MKRFLIAAFAAVVGLSMMVPEAEAKRLGGGSSIGMKRQATPATPAVPAKPAAAPAQAPAAAAPAAVPPKPAGMSRFLGPLAGLAAGLGIAALLSHFGLGDGMANFLLIALLVFAAVFVVRMLMRKREPEAATMQYAGAMPGTAGPANFTPAQFEAAGTGGAAAAALARNIPADFDADGFLRQAKLNFVRLQAANDRGDMDDIREFTSPEMFAEIKMQYQERGSRPQETDVMQLNAELLEVVTEEGRHIASVHFSGQLREDGAAPESFAETWHLVKPVDGSRGWMVAGIQQIQ